MTLSSITTDNAELSAGLPFTVSPDGANFSILLTQEPNGSFTPVQSNNGTIITSGSTTITTVTSGGAGGSGGGTFTGAFAGATTGALAVNDATDTLATYSAAQIAQNFGATIYAPLLANSTVFGTVGKFWNATDAAAGGGTVDAVSLINAAATFSMANNRRVYFPSGLYALGNNTFSFTGDNLWFEFAPDARITYTATSSNYSLFNHYGNNHRVKGGVWGPPDGNYVDLFSTLLLTEVDRSNFRTLNAGDWTGITILASWLTSAVTLFTQNSNILYFDALPSGYTLSSMQALLNAQRTYVVSQLNIVNGSYVSSGSALSAVTIGAWSGYQLILTPPSGSTYAVISTSFGAVPALAQAPEKPDQLATFARPALPQPTVYLLSAPPVFHTGGVFSFQGNGFTLQDMEIRNLSKARGIIGYGNNLVVNRLRGWATDGQTGSAIIRQTGGSYAVIDDFTLICGDAAIQFVPAAGYVNGAFTSASDLNLSHGIYSNGFACSVSGDTINIATGVQNKSQSVSMSIGSGTTIPIGNSFTIPGPLPTGITLAQLQASGPIYANSTAIGVGGKVVANGNLYVCVTAGTTAATGSGPSGTTNTITDGTCVFNYVSAGQPVYVYGQRQQIIVGSAVISASYANNQLTCQLQPPPGNSNAITTAITSGSLVFVGTVGAPPGSMIASITGAAVRNCVLMNISGLASNCGNEDSAGTVDIEFSDITVDSSYCLTPATTNSAVFTFLSLYGGMRISFNNVKIPNPYYYALNVQGNVRDLDITNCLFGPPQSSGATKSNVFIIGAQNVFIDRSTTIYSGVGGALTIGGNSVTDDVGDVYAGTVSQARISAVFRGLQDGMPNIVVGPSTNVQLKGCVAIQASPLGTGSAAFAQISSAASGVAVGDNDLSQIDGQPYTVQTGATISYGTGDVYNPTPAATGVTFPTADVYAAIGSVSGSLASVSSNASTALANAATALSAANTASTSATTAITTANTASSLATSASTTATQALGIAQAAIPATASLTATSLPSSSSPTVQISGSGTSTVLSFGIPAGVAGTQGTNGAPGNPGPVSVFNLSITGTWNASTNTPTLSTGGGGGVANQAYIVTTAGTQSITGTSTAYAIGDYAYCNAAGNAWVKVPGQNGNVTPGSLTIPNATTPTLGIFDDGTSDGIARWVDGLGGVQMTLNNGALTSISMTAANASFGTLAATSLTTPTVSAPTISATSTLNIASNEIYDNGSTNGTLFFTNVLGFILTSISNSGLAANTGTISNLTVNNLTVSGTLTASGLGESTTSFSTQDIAGFNASALATGTAQRAIPNTTSQRASCTYNHQITAGQSHGAGYQGSPALSTTQPYDCLMFSQSPRPSDMKSTTATTFTAIGDSLFHPLTATNQIGSNDANATLDTIKTGYIPGIQGLTISATGTTGVVSWTGSQVTTGVLAVGDTIDFSGFAAPYTGNNSNGNQVYTITGLTSNSVTITGYTAFAVNYPLPVPTAVNGITIAEVNFSDYGEAIDVGVAHQWRAEQLRQRELNADPSRLLVVNNCAVNGTTIAQWQKNASPTDFYNRVIDVATQMKAEALAVNSSATVCCPAIIWQDGGTDVAAGTTTTAYYTGLETLYANWITDLATVYGAGQTAPPIFMMIGVLSNSTDYDSTGTVRMPVPMAQLQFCGLAPTIGYGTPYTPDVYMACPSYQFPDHGLHFTNNGYRWASNTIGKALAQVATLGRTWKPVYPIKVINRGLYILVTFSVPVPPLTTRQCFVIGALTSYSDLGFSVTDDISDPLPATAGASITGISGITVQIISDVSVLITLPRALSTNPYLWYADNGNHGGNGNLCDSDATVSADSWSYTLGSGQAQVDNQPAYNGLPYPQNNWCMPFALPIVPG